MQNISIDQSAERVVELLNNFDESKVNIVFLYAPGSTGSMLLHSLFDGHPQVLSLPGFFPYYSFYEKYKNSRSIVKSFFNMKFLYTPHFDIRDEYSSHPDIQGYYLKKILLKVFEDYEISRKNLLLAMYFTYGVLSGFDFNKLKTIFHHEHNFISRDHFEKEVLNDFPYIKPIFPVRNFFDMYLSAKKLLLSTSKNNPEEIKKAYISFFSVDLIVFKMLKEILKLTKKYDNYKIVKFEHIHQNNEEILKELIEYMNIEYDECLQQSTFQGRLWWGNMPHNALNGTNPNYKEGNALKVLDNSEKYYITKLTKEIQENLGYKIDQEPELRYKGKVPYMLTDFKKKLCWKILNNKKLSKNPIERYRFLQYLLKYWESYLKEAMQEENI